MDKKENNFYLDIKTTSGSMAMNVASPLTVLIHHLEKKSEENNESITVSSKQVVERNPILLLQKSFSRQSMTASIGNDPRSSSLLSPVLADSLLKRSTVNMEDYEKQVETLRLNIDKLKLKVQLLEKEEDIWDSLISDGSFSGGFIMKHLQALIDDALDATKPAPIRKSVSTQRPVIQTSSNYGTGFPLDRAIKSYAASAEDVKRAPYFSLSPNKKKLKEDSKSLLSPPSTEISSLSSFDNLESSSDMKNLARRKSSSKRITTSNDIMQFASIPEDLNEPYNSSTQNVLLFEHMKSDTPQKIAPETRSLSVISTDSMGINKVIEMYENMERFEPPPGVQSKHSFSSSSLSNRVTPRARLSSEDSSKPIQELANSKIVSRVAAFFEQKQQQEEISACKLERTKSTRVPTRVSTLMDDTSRSRTISESSKTASNIHDTLLKKNTYEKRL